MKQIIRLTESDLHRIVKESVNKVLREMGSDEWDDCLNNERRIKNTPKRVNDRFVKMPDGSYLSDIEVNESVERILKESDSGIHIKPENKGKFTATKKATGKSTEELTHSKNPLTRKRANFAKMAKRHWKPLKEEYRSIFDIPYVSDKSLNAMEKAFTNYVKGSDVIAKGVKVLRGEIQPEMTYFEAMGVNRNTLMPGDIVIEYPDGNKHTLMRK